MSEDWLLSTFVKSRTESSKNFEFIYLMAWSLSRTTNFTLLSVKFNSNYIYILVAIFKVVGVLEI